VGLFLFLITDVFAKGSILKNSTIEVDKRTISYLSIGTGKKNLVFLHGLFAKKHSGFIWLEHC
jgi:hypothetical protein